MTRPSHDQPGAANKCLRFPALRCWDLDGKQTAIFAGILLLTLLAYLRGLNNGFVFHDEAAILENRDLNQWSFIWQSFIHDVWWFSGRGPLPHSPYYRPLHNVWLALNFHLVGLHPAGWHLLRVLLHLCAVALAFRAAQLLTASTRTALLVALLFGLLPANGAAILSIQAVGEPLATVFTLGAFCMFIRRSKNQRLSMTWPLILFTAAAFSHEIAVLFPLVIATYVFLFETGDEKVAASTAESDSLARRIGDAAAWSAPFVAVSLFYLGARAMALGPSEILGGSHPSHPLTFAQVLMTIPSVLVYYLELLLFPWLVGPAHDIGGVMTPGFSSFYLPAAILMLLSLTGYLVFRNSPHSRLYLFCAVWWLVALAPALTFTHLMDFVQDRYLYLPSFAFCLLLASCAIQFTHTSVARTRAVTAAAIVLAVVYVGKLWRMAPIWHDNLALFTRCVEGDPNSHYFQTLLDIALIRSGQRPPMRKIHKSQPND